MMVAGKTHDWMAEDRNEFPNEEPGEGRRWAVRLMALGQSRSWLRQKNMTDAPWKTTGQKYSFATEVIGKRASE